MDDATILSGCIFGSVGLVVFWLTRMFRGDESKMRNRLSNAAGPSELDSQRPTATGKDQFKQLFARIGSAASKPFMPETREKQSELRRRLAMAGIYSPSAIRVVVGFKTILMVVGVIGGYALGSLMHSLMLGLSVGGLIGYLAP